MDAFIKATQDVSFNSFVEFIAISKEYRDNDAPMHKQAVQVHALPQPCDIFAWGSRSPSDLHGADPSDMVATINDKYVNPRSYCVPPFTGKVPLYWFSDSDNTVYAGECKQDTTEVANMRIHIANKWTNTTTTVKCAEIKNLKFSVHWKKVERPIPKKLVCWSTNYKNDFRYIFLDGIYLQSFDEILQWIENPYYRKWVNEYVAKLGLGSDVLINSLAFLVTRPELELINKVVINEQAGPKFFEDIMIADRSFHHRNDDIAKLFAQWNRIFKAGTKFKDICSLPIQLIHSLWTAKDCSKWDIARKMVNLRGCTPDEVVRLTEDNNRIRMGKIDEILRAKYNNKPVFTAETLLNYINRLDVYQGIYEYEALDLIRDCLSMCRFLNQNPTDIFEKDSIKREHDLMMRRKVACIDAKLKEDIDRSCTDKFAYKNDEYFVRQIKNYDDLVDEGTQQHNCLVNAYSKRIAEGTSLIYVMRSLKNPESSLISIELDPSGQDIRQKYLAYNQGITNPDQLKFIQEWNQFRQEIIEAEMETTEV